MRCSEMEKWLVSDRHHAEIYGDLTFDMSRERRPQAGVSRLYGRVNFHFGGHSLR